MIQQFGLGLDGLCIILRIIGSKKQRELFENNRSNKKRIIRPSFETDLPNWANAGRLILLVQPSSAAYERVFSILNSSFSSQQESSLN